MVHTSCILVPSLALKTVGGFGRVGFTGSRSSGSSAAFSCTRFLSAVSSFSGSVGVGCARGVDLAVRGQFASAVVFRVRPPLCRAAFAQRSARLVGWVGSSGLLVAFPASAAPLALRPSRSFRGFGSGTWGSVALALGLGVSVLVVLPVSVCPVGSAFPAPASVASRFRFLGRAPCGGSLFLAARSRGRERLLLFDFNPIHFTKLYKYE